MVTQISSRKSFHSPPVSNDSPRPSLLRSYYDIQCTAASTEPFQSIGYVEDDFFYNSSAVSDMPASAIACR